MSEKSKNLVYYKLGPKATLFVEGKNLFVIRNKEVVAVDRADAARSGSVQVAIRHAHIQEATQKEYDAFKSGLAAVPEVEDETDEIPGGGEGEGGGDDGTTELPEGMPFDEWDELTREEMLAELQKHPDVISKKELKDAQKMKAGELTDLYTKYFKFKQGE